MVFGSFLSCCRLRQCREAYVSWEHRPEAGDGVPPVPVGPAGESAGSTSDSADTKFEFLFFEGFLEVCARELPAFFTLGSGFGV